MIVYYYCKRINLLYLKGNDLEFIRIPGVLQRFGIAYLVAALAYYPFANRAKSVSVTLNRSNYNKVFNMGKRGRNNILIEVRLC